MTIQEPMYPALRPALAGRFQIETFLGRGGMGLVYLAREVRLDRLVALKVLAPEHAASSERQSRFLREARIAAALSHPNIVPVFNVEQVGDVVFFAMAYVVGETLEERVRRAGPLPPLEVGRLLGVVADALATAHRHGVVHCDVKPDNILLEAGTGRVLLADFGIAELSPVGPGAPGESRIVGTAGFMSPEQARGGRVDARSDLYSLGVVAYYALSERVPFDAASDERLLELQRTATATPVASVAPHVPRRLARIVDRCLATEPGARFENGFALASAITFALRALDDPPLAIRAFRVRSRHLVGAARLYAALWGLVALPAAFWFWLHSSGLVARLGATIGLAALLLPPLLVLVARTHRLLALGHDLEELREALRVEWARRRDELAFAYGVGPSGFELLLRRVSRAAVLVTTAIAVAVEVAPALADAAVAGIAFGASGGGAVLTALVARARYEQRTEPLGSRRVLFWEGWLGRLVFRLAGLAREARRPVATSDTPFVRVETPA